MSPLTSGEIRSLQLATLRKFHEFCASHKLQYELMYGTLLGSVRHQGYIPWDDDIDVSMPRADYEEFLSLFEVCQTPELKLGHPAKGNDWPLPFAKLWAADTLVVENSALPLKTGVGIDIFPVDAAPAGSVRQAAFFGLARLLLGLEILLSVKTRPDHAPWKRLLLGLARPLLVLGGPSKVARARNRLARSSQRSPGHRGVLVGSYIWSVAPEHLSRRVALPFEGAQFMAPAGWNAVLSALYGPDFMKPPPEGMRSTHHAYEAFRIPNQEIREN